VRAGPRAVHTSGGAWGRGCRGLAAHRSGARRAAVTAQVPCPDFHFVGALFESNLLQIFEWNLTKR
jgi:hypothetical protein